MSQIKFAASILGMIAGLPMHGEAQTVSNPAPKGTATVAGRVVLRGEPARGMTVALLPEQMDYPSNQSLSLRANSDENGRFVIAGIKAGRYYLRVLAPGLIMQKASEPGERGRILNLAEGENVENEEITLLRGGVIAGRVVDSQGRPVGEEPVRLTVVDENDQRRPYYGGSNSYMFGTDDRGFYRLYGLPIGRYLVSVGYAQRDGYSSPTAGHTFYPLIFHPDATEESEAKIIEVGEGSEQTGVDIKVSAPSLANNVFGRVVNVDTGQPAAGVAISYGTLSENGKWAGSWRWESARTDAKGEFQVSAMKPGRYVFSARFDGESDFYSETPEAEVGASELRGIEIKVRRGCSIKGVVMIEGANDPLLREKLKRFQIVVSPRSDQPFFPFAFPVYVKADGTFQIRGVRPGKVDLRINQTPDLMGFITLRVENNGAPVSEGLELKPGEQVNNVRFVLGYGKGVIRGEVKITGGEWSDEYRMGVNAERKGDSRHTNASGQVDSRGRFLIEHLLPGEYELRLAVYSGGQRDERIAQINQLASRIRQIVNVGDAGEARTTITIDLSQKEQKNEK